PRLRIQRGVLAASRRVRPVPGGERSTLRFAGCKNLRHCGFALRLHKYRKLVGGDILILVDSGLDMPALEIPPVGARESSRPDTAHRSALPETVVDVGQFGLPATRICRRLPDGNTPRGGRNLVTGNEKNMCGQKEAKEEVREAVHVKRALSSCHG